MTAISYSKAEAAAQLLAYLRLKSVNPVLPWIGVIRWGYLTGPLLPSQPVISATSTLVNPAWRWRFVAVVVFARY